MSADKCKVLCVDDHVDTGVMLSYLLSDANYEVVTASTVDEALKHAYDREFDLYVLDKRFPDGTGIELCKKIREIQPRAQIIFYSGDAYQIQRQDAFDAGADLYVTKPYIDELLSAVNNLLSAAGCAAA